MKRLIVALKDGTTHSFAAGSNAQIGDRRVLYVQDGARVVNFSLYNVMWWGEVDDD